MEILTFYGIIFYLIAPQNDRLNLNFVKDIYAIAEKVARKGRK